MANQQISAYNTSTDALYRSAYGDTKTLLGESVSAGSEAKLAEEQARDLQRTQTSNRLAEEILGRRQRALGLKLSDRQMAAQKKRLALGARANEVATLTRGRDNFQDRARIENLANAGIFDFLQDLEISGLGTAAELEHQRNVAKQVDKGNSFASMMGGVGMLAGAGLGLAFPPAGAAAGAGVV